MQCSDPLHDPHYVILVIIYLPHADDIDRDKEEDQRIICLHDIGPYSAEQKSRDKSPDKNACGNGRFLHRSLCRRVRDDPVRYDRYHTREDHDDPWITVGQHFSELGTLAVFPALQRIELSVELPRADKDNEICQRVGNDTGRKRPQSPGHHTARDVDRR